MRTRQKSKPEFTARQLAQESEEAESEKEITEKRKPSLENFVFLKGQLLVAEEEIERLKQQIDAQKKQIKEIKIAKDEALRVKGTEINNLKEKLRVVESTPVRIRLTDNRPNSNIQTKVYHADQTVRNDQQWSDVVRSKSQREPEREHTRKRQREHQRELERERERKREHERQRQRQHQRKRELERERESKYEREHKRHINIGDHAVTVIGTSLVRGVATELCKHNIDALAYTYPGAPIPRLVGRLRHIINQDNSNIVLQCGGNDLELASPAAVVREYDHLISEVRQLAPNAHIYISAIPPRKGRAHILEDIAKVNTYLSNRGRRGDNVTCMHVCPTDLHNFCRDKVHFNDRGRKEYGVAMASVLKRNLHMVQNKPLI